MVEIIHIDSEDQWFIDRLTQNCLVEVINAEERVRETHPGESFYGYTYFGVTWLGDILTLPEGYVFSIPANLLRKHSIATTGKTIIFSSPFDVQLAITKVEAQGRLGYINGCSDTVLIYPPIKGMSCMNHLHIPPNTSQTMHTHPSIRMGIIIKGEGRIHTKKNVYSVLDGNIFCIDTNEEHYFSTGHADMDVVVYHPDSDWGPTDKVHPMLSRTHIK